MADMKRKFKTTKTLSGTKTEFRAWKEWDEDDVLVGKLIGTSQNRKNKSKKDWIVQVEDAFFADKKEQKRVIGKKLTLNTAGQLDKGLEQIEIGDLFQVTYNGSKEMEGGDHKGAMAHLMEVVEVREDNGDDFEEEDLEDEDNFDEDEEDL